MAPVEAVFVACDTGAAQRDLTGAVSAALRRLKWQRGQSVARAARFAEWPDARRPWRPRYGGGITEREELAVVAALAAAGYNPWTFQVAVRRTITGRAATFVVDLLGCAELSTSGGAHYDNQTHCAWQPTRCDRAGWGALRELRYPALCREVA